MKILFYATHYSQPIGYARVAHKLVNFLAEQGHDIYYYAITNYNQNNPTSRLINSNVKIIDVFLENNNDPYGYLTIKDTIEKVRPDLFFIYNDVIVTCNLLNHIKDVERSFKIVTYLDIVYDYERTNYISFIDSNVDKIIVFSEHWKKNLVDMNIIADKISILPHGIDECFTPLDKKECREILGLSNEDFIVFNTNRNSYRKALDITVKSFLMFLKNNNFNSNIKLYLNCYLSTFNGYDIPELTRTECLKMGIDHIHVLNKHLFKYNTNEGGITDLSLNRLYCATDVGVNTCLGEGFGLCNLEHLSMGVPQITSKVGGLTDFIPEDMMIDPVVTISASNILDQHNGDLNICDYRDFANKLQDVYTGKIRCMIDTDMLREKYSWDTILNEFKDIISI